MKRNLVLALFVVVFSQTHVRADLAGTWTVTNFSPPGSVYSDLYWMNGTEVGGEVGFVDTTQLHAVLWHGGADNWEDIHPGGNQISGTHLLSGDNPVGSIYPIQSGSRLVVWAPSGDSYTNLHPADAINSSWGYGASDTQIAGIVDGRSSNPQAHAAVWQRSDVTSSDWSLTYLHPAGSTASRASGTDGTRQVGQAMFNGVFEAGMWSGTADSWVSLAPTGASNSHAGDIEGDLQVGSVKFGTGDGLAALWYSTPESYVDMNPFGASRSAIWKTTGDIHVGHAVFADAPHAGIWLEDTADDWLDLHSVLEADFDWSYGNNVYAFGDEIWVTGRAGTYDLSHTQIGTQAMLWHYTPDVVPVPGAALLGAVGLSFAHLRLRRRGMQ